MLDIWTWTCIHAYILSDIICIVYGTVVIKMQIICVRPSVMTLITCSKMDEMVNWVSWLCERMVARQQNSLQLRRIMIA